VLPVGSIVDDAASTAGFMAAAIVVCGFLGQAPPALRRKDDQTVRARTVVGGLFGFAVSIGTLAIGYLIG
jgi:hypothetical protein